MHSLGIVQWNSTRRDHPGNPGGVSGSGPVTVPNRTHSSSSFFTQKTQKGKFNFFLEQVKPHLYRNKGETLNLQQAKRLANQTFGLLQPLESSQSKRYSYMQ